MFSASKSPTGLKARGGPIDTDITLGQCLDRLTATLPYYNSFAAALNNISSSVNSSHLRLNNVQLITTHILRQESVFSVELEKLNELYNKLAARSNSLATWMAEEKRIRDQLAVFYNGMTVLHRAEKTKLSEMSNSLRSALALMKDIDRRTSAVLQGVADAAAAIRPWALNVTTSADSHTLRLDSLATSMQWRIQQIQTTKAEQLKLARFAKSLAMHYSNASLVQQATTLLERLS